MKLTTTLLPLLSITTLTTASPAPTPSSDLDFPPTIRPPPPTNPMYQCTYYQNPGGRTTFVIHGGNFPEQNLGRWGKGLLDNLRQCGNVYQWAFDGSPKRFRAGGDWNKSHVAWWCITESLGAVGGPRPGYCRQVFKKEDVCGRPTPPLTWLDSGPNNEWAKSNKGYCAEIAPITWPGLPPPTSTRW